MTPLVYQFDAKTTEDYEQSLLLENPRGKGCRARVTREQRSRRATQ